MKNTHTSAVNERLEQTTNNDTYQIILENVDVDYPTHPRALQGINLRICARERIAVIGPSGSGKSTLLKTISGILPAAAGSISIASCALCSQTRNANQRFSKNGKDHQSSIGMIFQEYALAPRLSVLTNVLIGSLGRTSTLRGMFGMFSPNDRVLAHSFLKAVGLEGLDRKRVDQLSSGQKQRVAIARALMQEQCILLADEPVASLDIKTSRSIMELLTALQEEMRFTLLITLHDLDDAKRFCPRTIGIKEGRIVYDGPTSALNQPQLEQIFGKDEILHDVLA